MSCQGKAYTREQKAFIVRLQQAYDDERLRQPLQLTTLLAEWPKAYRLAFRP